MVSTMARDVSIDKLRNIGIMAHIDAGKTTTTERILFLTGITHKIGETHEGESQMDWMEQEKERGITITSAATTCHWKGYRLNIIDTPGHVDFTIEVQRSLRVLDGAIALIDAQAGVEPQTETVWRQANEYKVPRMICANKMEKMGADFYYSLDTIKSRLGANAAPIMLPIGAEQFYEGYIDLVTKKAYKYDGTEKQEVSEMEIPADMVEKTEEYRTKLIEAVADFDEDLMMTYLDGGEITVDRLKAAIRKCTLSVDFFPVLCADALGDKGTRALLDAVIDYLPAPTDIEAIDPLIEATTDDNAQIRFKAAEILGNMGEVARDKLIEKFEASEGKNKRFLTFALKETKDEKVIPYFASAVEDDDFGVRKTAIRALGELQAHDELYTIAKGLEDEDWGVRLATIYALGDLASDESIDLIKDARRNEKDKDFKKSCNKALKKAEKAKKAKASGETLSKVKPISTIKEMEKTNVQKAIKEYEQYVTEEQPKDAPYKRLCILYRKNNDLENEIRILNKAIEVLSKKKPGKEDWFEKRLAKLN